MPGGHAPQIVAMDRFLEQLVFFQNVSHCLFKAA